MDRIAEQFVHLVLALGEHDLEYVDAFYGPKEWVTRVKQEKMSPQAIRDEALDLIARLGPGLPDRGKDASLRHRHLVANLKALVVRAEMVLGAKFSFDEESKLLYDIVAHNRSQSYFEDARARLQTLLPGKGSLGNRYEHFKYDFVLNESKLNEVFASAIWEAGRRTRQRITLPPDEDFEVEYVTGEAWGAYNWYKGDSHSIIQVNLGLPFHIDQALDLACHEGYPGHHVYNTLVDTFLVKQRGWVEFCVHALFGPQSAVCEGSANYGIELAFPGLERIEFEREILFPLAGLDPAKADLYYIVQRLIHQLRRTETAVARLYLDGRIGHDEAVNLLATDALMAIEVACQRVRFFEKYRSYVINYSVGYDLVSAFIGQSKQGAASPISRWDRFKELLMTPAPPSVLGLEPSLCLQSGISP
jgi:hypothetical protein